MEYKRLYLHTKSRNHKPNYLVIGNFDGVHIGHQHLISSAREIYPEANLSILSFYPHPRRVLSNKSEENHCYLQQFKEKFLTLQAAGVSSWHNLYFDSVVSQLSAEEFAEKIIKGMINPTAVIVGEDFSLGRNRHADLNQLKVIFNNLGIEFRSIALLPDVEGQKISSSNIKKLVTEGKISQANKLLGHDYIIRGVVVKGSGLATEKLSVPTANINLTNSTICLPKKGVYAIIASDGSDYFFGIANLGTRPTMTNQSNIMLEVHLFNYSGDLYQKILSVRFVKFLREEKKFNGLQELKEQIDRDVREVKKLFVC